MRISDWSSDVCSSDLKDSDFEKVDLIVLPGGFSYGDYLRCGAMAANSPVMKEVVARAHKGVAVLGICNGFQMLTETRLLPGTLMRNADLRFVCRDVRVKVESSQSLRSEEHTSELQSLMRISYAVFCLKKKKKKK